MQPENRDGSVHLPPTPERVEKLAGRAKVLAYYDILQNDDGELMFALAPTIPGEAENAVLLYDGGAHALLVKNRLFAVVCDYLHPTIRAALPATPRILVIEGSRGDRIHAEYMVPVCRYEGIEQLCARRIEAVNQETEV